MPSTTRGTALLVLSATVVGVAVVARRPLFGVFLATVVYTVGWLIGRVSPGSPLDDVTRERTLATGGIVLTIIAYAVLVAANVLLGVVVAMTVAVASWLTSPFGPVARWLDRRA